MNNNKLQLIIVLNWYVYKILQRQFQSLKFKERIWLNNNVTTEEFKHTFAELQKYNLNPLAITFKKYIITENMVI